MRQSLVLSSEFFQAVFFFLYLLVFILNLLLVFEILIFLFFDKGLKLKNLFMRFFFLAVKILVYSYKIVKGLFYLRNAGGVRYIFGNSTQCFFDRFFSFLEF